MRARLMRLFLTAQLFAALTTPVLAEAPAGHFGLGTFGTPALIDMPRAVPIPDGTLAFTGFAMPGTWRSTLTFQLLPRVTGSFRYSGVDIGLRSGQRLFDRSFDIHAQILNEGEILPAVALGLRDILGTGHYASEYIVATRHLTSRLQASFGMGWGRLATRGGFENPLAFFFGDRFKTRPGGYSGTGGRLEVERWFRGDAALFGGLSYQTSDRLTFLLEYSSDAYEPEQRGGLRVRSPLNFGLRYRLGPNSEIAVSFMHGTVLGISGTVALNPASPPGGPVQLTRPLPVRQRATSAATPQGARGAAAGFGPASAAPEELHRLMAGLAPALAQEGLELNGLALDGRQAVVRLTNRRHDVLPRALGRAARVLSWGLPENIEEIVLIPMRQGVPGTAVVIPRPALEIYAESPLGAEALLNETRLADAVGFPGVGRWWQPLPPNRGRVQWAVGPYATFSYFDPDEPMRADFGLQFAARLHISENLTINGLFTQRIAGNIDKNRRWEDDPQCNPTGGPVGRYPCVRIHAARYSTDRPTINRLTLDYTARPAPDLFARLSLGWLERMYGGVSGEVLWSPPASRFSIGLELNAVRQRDPDALLGFHDLWERTGFPKTRLTGHASLYYSFADGWLAQVHVGRYLAGDRGATLMLERAFANGIRVGAYATLTDMPFEAFGEGSFDKGIMLTIPLTALSGRPSTSHYAATLRSLQRDGGARLEIANRLWPTIQESRAQALRQGWGAFLQ